MEELRKWQRASALEIRQRYAEELLADARLFTEAIEALAAGGLCATMTQLDMDTRIALGSQTNGNRLLLVRDQEYWLEIVDGEASLLRYDAGNTTARKILTSAEAPSPRDGLVDADDEHFVVRVGSQYWEVDYDLRKRIIRPFQTEHPLAGAYVAGRFSFYALAPAHMELPGGRIVPYKREMVFDCSGMYPVSKEGPGHAVVVIKGRPQRWRLPHWDGAPIHFLPYNGSVVAVYGSMAYRFLNGWKPGLPWLPECSATAGSSNPSRAKPLA